MDTWKVVFVDGTTLDVQASGVDVKERGVIRLVRGPISVAVAPSERVLYVLRVDAAG